MTYDAIVVGAGLAGLSAALRLCDGGLRVLVVAKGVGAIQLGGATVDVLGYAPDLVTRPAKVLPSFMESNLAHPYARLTVMDMERAVRWFEQVGEPLGYSGSLETNLLVPTAVGALRPTCVVPESVAAGDISRGARVVVVGLPALKDFFAPYLAGNLTRAAGSVGVDASARSVELTVPVHEADVTPLGFARLFDDAEFRKAVIDDLRPRVDAGEVVAFPAVLGVDDPRAVWRELQDGLEGPVFEVPTLPPSVPGIRLFRVLKAALRERGGRLLLGSTVVGAATEGARVSEIVVEAAARSVRYAAHHFVLASGGFAAGGFEMDSTWTVREAVFGLALTGVPGRDEERFARGYFDRHPMGRAGLATDDRLRPAGEDGAAAYSNLYTAGAALAGAEPWREKSGDGISLSTGHRAAELILEAA